MSVAGLVSGCVLGANMYFKCVFRFCSLLFVFLQTNCFRFACSAEAVLPMGLRLECKGLVVCLSVGLSLKLLGRRLRRRPDWREAAA